MSLRSDFLAAVPASEIADFTLNGQTFKIGVKIYSFKDYDAALKTFQDGADDHARAAVMAGWFFDPVTGEPLFTPEDIDALPLSVSKRLITLFSEVNMGTLEAKKN